MPETMLSCAEIAAKLELSERQVWRLVKDGRLNDGTAFPSRVEGRSRTFPAARCFAWYVEYKQEEALSRAASNTPSDLAEVELRKATADAELAELKLQKLRADVVPIEDYRAELTRVLGNVRARLLSAPGEYASRLPVDMALAVKLLRDIMTDVMVELQHVGDPDEADEAATAA